MPIKHSASVNLVKGSRDDLFNKLVDWALTIGRLLVIITEIIALSSFIYRFTLDSQIIDLHSKIKQQETLVSFFKKKEDSYRNLQDRLTIASDFSSEGEKKLKIFQDVMNLMPPGMTLNKLDVSQNSIIIDSKFQSTSSFKSFIQSLRGYSPVTKVSIGKIENRLSNAQILVTITASLVAQ